MSGNFTTYYVYVTLTAAGRRDKQSAWSRNMVAQQSQINFTTVVENTLLISTVETLV